MKPSLDDIMSDLAATLRNFHGREYSGAITPRTQFFADLGLASIDAVVLGETLEQRYAHRLPFDAFMADLGRRAVRDVEVGELAAFVHKHLTTGE
jgi:acyl carrier protein